MHTDSSTDTPPSTVLAEVSPEALFDFYPRLVGVCRGFVHDHHEAEDLAQSSLIKAVRHLERFDPDRPAWPWLKRIAQNTCRDHLREHRHVHIREYVLEPATDTPTIAQRLVDIDLCDRILDELPSRQANVLRLYKIEGWSRDELAKHFESSVQAIDQLLYRARNNARTAFQRFLDSELAVLLGGWLVRIRVAASKLLAPSSDSIPMLSMIPGVAAGIVAGIITLMAPGGHGDTAVEEWTTVASQGQKLSAGALREPSTNRAANEVHAGDLQGANLGFSEVEPSGARYSIDVAPDVPRSPRFEADLTHEEDEVTLDSKLWSRVPGGDGQPLDEGQVGLSCTHPTVGGLCEAVDVLPGDRHQRRYGNGISAP